MHDYCSFLSESIFFPCKFSADWLWKLCRVLSLFSMKLWFVISTVPPAAINFLLKWLLNSFVLSYSCQCSDFMSSFSFLVIFSQQNSILACGVRKIMVIIPSCNELIFPAIKGWYEILLTKSKIPVPDIIVSILCGLTNLTLKKGGTLISFCGIVITYVILSI
jgi:hypothetical protein